MIFFNTRSPLHSRSCHFAPAPLRFPLRSRSAHMLWWLHSMIFQFLVLGLNMADNHSLTSNGHPSQTENNKQQTNEINHYHKLLKTMNNSKYMQQRFTYSKHHKTTKPLYKDESTSTHASISEPPASKTACKNCLHTHSQEGNRWLIVGISVPVLDQNISRTLILILSIVIQPLLQPSVTWNDIMKQMHTLVAT